MIRAICLISVTLIAARLVWSVGYAEGYRAAQYVVWTLKGKS
jgi:hypothetical protein